MGHIFIEVTTFFSKSRNNKPKRNKNNKTHELLYDYNSEVDTDYTNFIGDFNNTKQIIQFIKLFLNKIAIGGFTSGKENYWTSSEGSFDDAWIQNFITGGQTNPRKDNIYAVRAIRSF
mgnify:CR=1 FL=1